MRSRMISASGLLALLLLGACTPVVPTVEVTRIVPQTLAVTQPVSRSQTGASIPTSTQPAATTKPSALPSLPYEYSQPGTVTPTATGTPEPTWAAIMTLQDPAMVVVQYYTLLGEHLYREAYQLLSAKDRTNSADEEVVMMAQAYQRVQVLKVVRYNDWIQQNHIHMPPAGENVYYVQLYVVGENMVEMTSVDGIVETYAWAVRENGEVKIEFHGKLPYD
jgi:hypothetical protein